MTKFDEKELESCKKEKRIWIILAVLFILGMITTIFIAFAYAPPSFFLDWTKTNGQSIFTWFLVLVMTTFSILAFVYSYLNYKNNQNQKVV